MKFAFTLLVITFFMAGQSQSNGWRGITPLRSTCEDVKKSLGVDNCSVPVSNYTLPEFRVMIEFAKKGCGNAPHTWRVPKGTVVTIVLSPRKEMVPTEFGLDLSTYNKREDGEIVGLEHFTNEEDGITVDLYRGFVQNLFLYPRKADDRLRCKEPK